MNLRSASDMSHLGYEADSDTPPPTPNFYGLDDPAVDLRQPSHRAEPAPYDHYDPRALIAGSPPRQFFDQLDKGGFYDRDAPPGTPRNPIYDWPDAGRPQYGEAWVDRDGRYQPASGDYAAYAPVSSALMDDPPVPETLTGDLKSFGSGFLGSSMDTVAEADFFNSHGWANRVEGLAALGGWALRAGGAISPEQYQDLLRREMDFRHSLPNGTGLTTDEIQRGLGWYHTPQNHSEERWETGGSLATAIVAPEVAAEVGPARLARIAERAAMREAGKEALYLTGRVAAPTVRAVSAVAAPEIARNVIRHYGGDEADQHAGMVVAGILGLLPKSLGLGAPRPGHRWRLGDMPAENIHNFSTQSWPRDPSLQAFKRSGS